MRSSIDAFYSIFQHHDSFHLDLQSFVTALDQASLQGTTPLTPSTLISRYRAIHDSPNAAVEIQLLFDHAGKEQLQATQITDMILEKFTQTEVDFLPRSILNEINNTSHQISPQLHECRQNSEAHIDPSTIRHQKNRLHQEIQRAQFCTFLNSLVCLPSRSSYLLLFDRQCNLVKRHIPMVTKLSSQSLPVPHSTYIYDFAVERGGKKIAAVMVNNLLSMEDEKGNKIIEIKRPWISGMCNRIWHLASLKRWLCYDSLGLILLNSDGEAQKEFQMMKGVQQVMEIQALSRIVISCRHCDKGSSIMILNGKNLKSMVSINIQHTINETVFIPHFNTVAYSNFTGEVKFLVYKHELNELEQRPPIHLHPHVISTLSPIPQTSTLLSISVKNEVCLFNLGRGISYKRCQLTLNSPIRKAIIIPEWNAFATIGARISLIKMRKISEHDEEQVAIYSHIQKNLILQVCTRTSLRKYTMSHGHLLSITKLTTLQDPVVRCQSYQNGLVITLSSGKVMQEQRNHAVHYLSTGLPGSKSYIVLQDQLIIAYNGNIICLKSFSGTELAHSELLSSQEVFYGELSSKQQQLISIVGDGTKLFIHHYPSLLFLTSHTVLTPFLKILFAQQLILLFSDRWQIFDLSHRNLVLVEEHVFTDKITDFTTYSKGIIMGTATGQVILCPRHKEPKRLFAYNNKEVNLVNSIQTDSEIWLIAFADNMLKILSSRGRVCSFIRFDSAVPVMWYAPLYDYVLKERVRTVTDKAWQDFSPYPQIPKKCNVISTSLPNIFMKQREPSSKIATQKVVEEVDTLGKQHFVYQVEFKKFISNLYRDDPQFALPQKDFHFRRNSLKTKTRVQKMERNMSIGSKEMGSSSRIYKLLCEKTHKKSIREVIRGLDEKLKASRINSWSKKKTDYSKQ